MGEELLIFLTETYFSSASEAFVTTKTATVNVDVSIKAVGAMLSQDEHPALHAFRKLNLQY